MRLFCVFVLFSFVAIKLAVDFYVLGIISVSSFFFGIDKGTNENLKNVSVFP